MTRLLSNLLDACEQFWRRHPALLYGVAFLLGVSGALFSHEQLLLLPFGLLFFPLLWLFLKPSYGLLYKRLGAALLLCFAAYAYGRTCYLLPRLPFYGVEGVAEIAISSLQVDKTPFGTTYQIIGRVRCFTPAREEEARYRVKNGPVRMTFSEKAGSTLPPASCDYRIFGKLRPSGAGYLFKAKKGEVWRPVPHTWSLADYRYRVKKSLRALIEEHIPHPQSAAFLMSLATGDFSDRQISSSLGRLGLLHLMAISGFHFSLVAGAVSFLLRFCLSERLTTVGVLLLLGGYFIFLGPSPSVIRAWLSLVIMLMGRLIARRCSGLNALGMGMLLLLLFDPGASLSPAFQLSFLATLSILLFFPALDLLFQQLFPKRPLHEVIKMSSWDQHAIILLSGLRGAIALGFAVNLVMIPVSLFYFQKFPWLSLFYNLFFPLLASGSMLLLLLALSVSWLAPLAGLIHSVNNLYTQWVLQLTFDYPLALDYIWRVRYFPLLGLVLYLSFLGFSGLILASYLNKKRA